MRSCWQRMHVVVALCAVLLTSGCVSLPYQVGTGRSAEDAARSPRMKQQIVVGRPNKFLDASDWYWPGSLLGKLVLFNKNVDSHQISSETVDAVRRYLDENELTNVQVLVNAYSPGNQWQRLFKNRTVHPGWRYTLGFLSVVSYTIMPGRFFGGDAYNPYTNTIYLYSDEPAIGLHEGGHAKDFGQRQYKGTHAFLYQLPLASLYYEARASNDALSYVRCRDLQTTKEAYNLLYPAWSTYVGGNFSRFYSSPYTTLSVIPGHVVGRIRSANVEPCELPAVPSMVPAEEPEVPPMAVPSDGSSPLEAVYPTAPDSVSTLPVEGTGASPDAAPAEVAAPAPEAATPPAK